MRTQRKRTGPPPAGRMVMTNQAPQYGIDSRPTTTLRRSHKQAPQGPHPDTETTTAPRAPAKPGAHEQKEPMSTLRSNPLNARCFHGRPRPRRATCNTPARVPSHHDALRPHKSAPQQYRTGQRQAGQTPHTRTPSPELVDRPLRDRRSRDPERLLSPSEVAQTCNVSRKTIYRAVELGRLRACKIGNRLRIKHGDYQDWLERNTINSKDAIHRTAKATPDPPVHRIRDLLETGRS